MNAPDGIPVSEQYRMAAREYARLDGKARELEASKDHVLAKWARAMGKTEDGKEMSVAAAEREVKATQEWADFRTEIEQARTSANEARAEMEALQMKHEEKHGVRRQW
jgi:hypothetical protein